MTYLMEGQVSEIERLQRQSRVWEPVGERLLARLGNGGACQVLEIGCGAMGWLRLLSRWVGETGEVVGTDVDDRLLVAARAELADANRWGVTFTLVQTWGRVPKLT